LGAFALLFFLSLTRLLNDIGDFHHHFHGLYIVDANHMGAA
jgi:hypothetical protein